MSSDSQPDSTAPSNSSGTAGARPTKVRWLMFMLACGTSFVLYLHRYTWGFIKADVRDEFGWSEVQLGWLDSVFNASYAFGQIPSGILCDWFGPHILLGSIITLWSLSMGAVAFATGYTSMLTARLAFGLTQAGAYPTLSKVSKLWFPLSVRTSVQGWIATFFGRGGGAMSFFLMGTVLLGWFELEWRTAIAVLTVLGIIFAITFFLLFRNSALEHPWANEEEANLIAEGKLDEVVAAGTSLNWWNLLRSRNMRFFYIQQFTSAYADNVYVYWIPLFLLTVKNVETSGAGWMAALPLLGGAVGGMLGGTLQNSLIISTGNRRWSRSLIGLIGKLLATILIFVSLGFESAVVIVWILALVKFFGDWSQPTVWGTITDIAGKNSASVFASVNTVGSIAGFVAGPTMGFIIMAFSQTHVIDKEISHALSPNGESAAQTVRYETLAHRNLNGVVTGKIIRAEKELATFRSEMGGELSFSVSPEVEFEPVTIKSKLDRLRGTVQIGWQEETPDETHVVINYNYIDYGSGWGALFIALGAIYLVSSLAWLFIDCTVTLEEEAAIAGNSKTVE